ncbi:SGNH/GDSL hydrolase family protein [Streptomyces sp. NPDC056373]|uniref:SGNH/GDSL hydrolase family protein n=1 Tax=Streptomyces sp. NPDC056373 TaxID=3345798 RepID=UPI0035E16BAE
MSRTARPRCRAVLAALSCCVALGCGTGTVPQGGRPSPPPSAPRAAGPSVVTWASSAGHVGETAAGRGYRLMVRTSVGGSGLRVRLSNAFGDQPVTFANVHAGLRRGGAALVPGSNRRLTFGGHRSVTVPAGGMVYSDPLPGRVPAGRTLAVSMYVPRAAGALTGHWLAMQTSYKTVGDHAAEESAAHWKQRTGSWFYLDAVAVRPHEKTGAVAALGDSITDGWHSTTDRNRRWPDFLARRLRESTGTRVEGVANAGIAANKVLLDGPGQSALNRVQRDALSLPGVRTVFLFQGVNDIKAEPGATGAGLIAGYRRLIDRAHAAGKCVVGATIAPYKGWQEWDPAGEAVRRQVNAFIRDSGEFDAVADFDRVLRSPDDPERIRPAFDGGDHLHPDDQGMRAMADAVDLDSLDCGAGQL